MHRRESLFVCCQVVFLGLVVAFPALHGFARSVEKVIQYFPYDSAPQRAGLVHDMAGNLYGTTPNGNSSGYGPYGVVFELSPPTTGSGQWTQTVLYNFQGGTDGGSPWGALIFDKQGNLYGTTLRGNIYTSNHDVGGVFKLSPPATPGGAWTETTLWLFNPDGTGGATPYGKVVMDPDGNLYGTTLNGGTHGQGVVYELVAPKTSGGLWAERVLHNFGAAAKDGVNPAPDLLLWGGALYGTTTGGGANQDGIVFRLTRKPGAWTETILHDFTGTDGSQPAGQLVADSAGNLFGTAQFGGANGFGTIYELSPPALSGDPWQETTLYNFKPRADGGAGPDGGLPYAGLMRDKAGSLYGTATGGAVFKLKPPAVFGGAWTLVVLHDFRSTSDGGAPYGKLTRFNGVLYGTTASGGVGAEAYSIVP